MQKKYEMDMCVGPLVPKMIVFVLPLMFSGVLQLLFNAADMIVVGKYAGRNALAAVGSTGSLINLLINLFVGLSVGTNVLVAGFYGAKRFRDMSEVIHTSVILSLISGLFLMFIGILGAKPILLLMGTPDEVLGLAALYIRVYFAGMPVMLLYNFGSSILRALGDTKRPLYYLVIAGVINIVLNLFFVITLSMSVAGVALATVISQGISAVLLLRCLAMLPEEYRLKWKKLRPDREKAMRIIRTGLPAGVQGMVFSLSNVLIQSSVNSFGSVAMAGNAASSNIEGFIYVAMNAFYQGAICFTGQNYGGGRIDRVKKILRYSILMVTVVGFSLGMAVYLSGNLLLRLYVSDPEVIVYGMTRMRVIATAYFLCGIMDVMVGQLRGLGYSVMPMITSMLGACAFRVLWILTVFQVIRTLPCLYISYPISWAITASAHFFCYRYVFAKINKKRIEI